MGCKADVKSLVADICREKSSCKFLVDDTVFGDPCFGLEEFLDVEYSCVEGLKIQLVLLKKVLLTDVFLHLTHEIIA